MRVVAPRGRWVSEALELSGVLLHEAQARGEVMLAASLVQGPAVVLGAMQRAGRVVDMQACSKHGAVVLRRATKGTAAWLPELGLVFALALPNVASLMPDATPKTLLNRNVRGFLKGFTKAGAPAHYFGREWISFQRRPAALLGFETTRAGAVLIEVVVGFDEPIGLPEALMTNEERAIERWQGKSVAAVRDVCPDARIESFALKVMESVIDRIGQSVTEFDPVMSLESKRIADERDPVPAGFDVQSLQRVPIGYVDVAVCKDEPTRRWLGGDVLAPTWVYEDVAAGKEVSGVPIDGATIEDLVSASR